MNLDIDPDNLYVVGRGMYSDYLYRTGSFDPSQNLYKWDRLFGWETVVNRHSIYTKTLYGFNRYDTMYSMNAWEAKGFGNLPYLDFFPFNSTYWIYINKNDYQLYENKRGRLFGYI